MELLSVLEKKISLLIESKKKDDQKINELSKNIDHQKAEIARLEQHVTTLKEENNMLKENLEKVEHKLLDENKDVEDLHQERELTRMAVDDLIKSIDHLINVENEQQQ